MCTPVVSKSEGTMSRFLVWIWLALPLAITSCVRTFEYPAGWARPETGHSDQTCPLIAGVYQDYAELGPGAYFSGRHWDRGSLTYNLLSKENDQLRGRDHVSKDVAHLINAAPYVEIVQPAPNMLEVLVWSGEGNDQFIVGRGVLSAGWGDFSCGPDGLRLKTRTQTFFVGLSNFFGSVSRTLNRSEDGSLVMKIGEKGFGHHTFVPFGSIFDYWIRWTPISRSSP